MKLMFCPSCRDLKALRFKYRHCSCYQSSARVREDGNSVVYRGAAIILAMKDADLEQLPSMDSPLLFNLYKQKETYRTMEEKISTTELQWMGHRRKE